MRNFATLQKLHKGDKVAILSPSFAAPGKWPHVYDLGLERIKDVFGLVPVEYPTTKKIGATKEERSRDLIAAFEDTQIKGVISTLGGNDQVTYIKNLPAEPFITHPKPYFGYSDNSHFMNFLWLNGIPSFYGGALFTEFAEQTAIHPFTMKYLQKALFENGEVELDVSAEYNDIGINWDEPTNLSRKREYEPVEGWQWDGSTNAHGITWGGCLESIDEMLRHGVPIPAVEDFNDIVLLVETSEEVPKQEYVFRVLRALGERGILERVKGILVGRPKAWRFEKAWTSERKKLYRERQRETVISTVRTYNTQVPIVQNLDFGHSSPQILLPYGAKVRIEGGNKKIFIQF